MTIVKLVTAFTLGHSITPVVGSLQSTLLPAQPVEILIAVSGAHAICPLFAGCESFIAGGFGLVHRFAFVNSLRAFGDAAASLRPLRGSPSAHLVAATCSLHG